MSDNPTTEAASSGVVGADENVSNNPDLLKLEQAVAEAGSEQPTETTSEETEAQDEAPEYGQAFEELAAKKGFKSVDDLVSSYQENEGRYTKLAQEISELKKAITSPQQQKEDDPFAELPPEQRQALGLLQKIVDRSLENRLKPLREDLEVRKASEELQSMRKRFPGVGDTELEQAIGYVENNPSLALEDAVKIVTYEEAKRAASVTKEMAVKKQQKKRAFVESASTSKAGGDLDYSKLSLEDLEKILPSAGDFIDSKGTLRRH